MTIELAPIGAMYVNSETEELQKQLLPCYQPLLGRIGTTSGGRERKKGGPWRVIASGLALRRAMISLAVVVLAYATVWGGDISRYGIEHAARAAEALPLVAAASGEQLFLVEDTIGPESHRAYRIAEMDPQRLGLGEQAEAPTSAPQVAMRPNLSNIWESAQGISPDEALLDEGLAETAMAAYLPHSAFPNGEPDSTGSALAILTSPTPADPTATTATEERQHTETPTSTAVSTPTPVKTPSPTATIAVERKPTGTPTSTPVSTPGPAKIPSATATPVKVVSQVATKTPVPPPQLSSLEGDLLGAIGRERQNQGLSAVSVDGQLLDIARKRASDMAARSYFSHTSPEGRTVFDSFGAQDRARLYIGEVLARNNFDDQNSPQVAVSGFMQSPTHRQVVLRQQYQKVGVGVAVSSDGVKYYAVVFTS